jgi:hypothetical protein
MIDPMNSGADEQHGDSLSNQSGSGWLLILILACVALGFTASATEYERVAASNERNHAELLATECSAVEGHLEDLGKFLADPHTRLFPLMGSEEFARNYAVIAWNTSEQKGYFMCDNLPVRDAGSGYEIWALHGNDEPLKVTTIDAKPGASVYPFRTSQGKTGKMRLEVTAGPRSLENSPVFAGEIE